MADETIKYVKLPGSGPRKGSSNLIRTTRETYTVWMAGDHLLLVEQTGYSESYNRFYFTDIQAIIVRKTNMSMGVLIFTGVLALAFILLGMGIQEIGVRVTFWVIGFFISLFAIAELILGPTAVTHLQTPLQSYPIPAWNRLRAARKSLARIRPFLQQAQGQMADDVLLARWQSDGAAVTTTQTFEATLSQTQTQAQAQTQSQPEASPAPEASQPAPPPESV